MFGPITFFRLLHHFGSAEAALDEIERLDRVMSNFSEDSDLSRLNATRARQEVSVPADLYRVLKTSLYFSDVTGGAFDVTVAPLVRVRQFSAQLLGGQARSGPFELDFGREKNTFVVQLEQIGLNEIMKLEQQEGLAGSGMLDGQIPVEISSEGIMVTRGQLSARAPGGNIRYTPTAKVAALAQANPNVDIVVKALSNFQYHLLDVNTDYQPDGDLSLRLSPAPGPAPATGRLSPSRATDGRRPPR